MSLEYVEGSVMGERFESLHKLHTETGDGKRLVILSGIVRIDLKGESTKDWRFEEIEIQPKIPSIPQDTALLVEQWVPLVTINTIYNEDTAVGAGWGVNNFWVDLPGSRMIPYRNPRVNIKARVLVRDSDGWIFRVAYQLTMTGSLVEYIDPGDENF